MKVIEFNIEESGPQKLLIATVENGDRYIVSADQWTPITYLIPTHPPAQPLKSEAEANPQPVENNSAVWVKVGERIPVKEGMYHCKAYGKNSLFTKQELGETIEQHKENILWLDENSGASQLPEPTADRDYWKALAEKCIAEHPRIVEGL